MKSNWFFSVNGAGMLFFCMCIWNASQELSFLNSPIGSGSVKKLSQTGWKDSKALYELPENYAASLYPKRLYSRKTNTGLAVTRQSSNHPPVVKIQSPENNSLFQWNSVIEYTIDVSDVEDGKSASLDILSNEVFLELVYLPDASRAPGYAEKKKESVADTPGLSLIKTADCFSCHTIKHRDQGPAFLDIARRYPHNPATVKMLAERVIQGSSGVWGIAAMSSHPDLTLEQASQIIQWIFENSEDPDRDYLSGTRGSFRTRAKPEDGTRGAYVLTASYTDHGLKGMPQLRQRGQHTIVLYSQ